jgi:hypothetical protein
VPGLQERQRREKVQRIYRCDVEEVLIPPVLSPPEKGAPADGIPGWCLSRSDRGAISNGTNHLRKGVRPQPLGNPLGSGLLLCHFTSSRSCRD